MPSIFFLLDNSHLSRSADAPPSRLILQTSILSEVISQFVKINENHLVALSIMREGNYILQAPYSNLKTPLIDALNQTRHELPILPKASLLPQTNEENMPVHKENISWKSFLSSLKLSQLVTQQATNSSENNVILFFVRPFNFFGKENKDSETIKMRKELEKALVGAHNLMIVNFGNKELVGENKNILREILGEENNSKINVETFLMSRCDEEEKSNSDNVIDCIREFMGLPKGKSGFGDDELAWYLEGSGGDEGDMELQKALEMSMLDR